MVSPLLNGLPGRRPVGFGPDLLPVSAGPVRSGDAAQNGGRFVTQLVQSKKLAVMPHLEMSINNDRSMRELDIGTITVYRLERCILSHYKLLAKPNWELNWICLPCTSPILNFEFFAPICCSDQVLREPVGGKKTMLNYLPFFPTFKT